MGDDTFWAIGPNGKAYEFKLTDEEKAKIKSNKVFLLFDESKSKKDISSKSITQTKKSNNMYLIKSINTVLPYLVSGIILLYILYIFNKPKKNKLFSMS